MKRNNLFNLILVSISAIILIMSGIMFIHSAKQQTLNSRLSVSYVADNASFRVQAFYQVASEETITYFQDSQTPTNDYLNFIAADNESSTRTLSAPSNPQLYYNKPYVLFTFSFTNTATYGGYCIKVSLTDGAIGRSNVIVKYLSSENNYISNTASPTIAELNSQKLMVSSASEPKNVYIEAQDTKFFYVLIEIDNLHLNANYTSFTSMNNTGLVWHVQGTTEVNVPYYIVTLNPDGGTSGTDYIPAYYGEVMPSGATTPSKTGYTFDGYYASRDGGDTQYYDSSMDSVNVWNIKADASIFAKWTVNTYDIAYAGMEHASYGEYYPDIATYDTTFIVSNPTKPGHIFNGWDITGMDNTMHTYGYKTTNLTSLSGIKETTFMNLLSTAGTVTFTAQWELVEMPREYFVWENDSSGTPEKRIVGLSEIGYSAISSSSDKVITIPTDCTEIGEWAFAYSYWTSDYLGEWQDLPWTCVVIGSNVSTIGERAFSECQQLTTVIIPNSVTTIERRAFRGCSGLTSVTIPNSVTIIERETFRGCSGLTSVTIPNSVTIIETGAFRNCSGLTSINIPSSVTSIGREAFRDCSGLTSINIPSSVTIIGTEAFRGCSGLESIEVDEDNATYKDYGDCLIDIANKTLIQGCKNSVIPTDGSVTIIGDYAFLGCLTLTEINIPDSVTTIAEFAFSRCYGLTSITIPNSVTSIGYNAFSFCSALTSLTIGNSVTYIGGHAFYYCSALTSITIPASVTSIDYNAFNFCSALTSISVDENNTKYKGAGNCLIDKTNGFLFLGCNTSVIPLDNSVTRIETSAFEGCSGLTSITIPDSVTIIGDRAFCGCSGLTSIIIPNSVTSINYLAFSGCSALTTINIPSSVTSIGHSVFENCSSLTSITIPNSVTGIGDYAFSGCSALATITVLRPAPPTLGTEVFTYDYIVAIYVSSNSVDSYKNTTGWELYADKIQPIP